MEIKDIEKDINQIKEILSKEKETLSAKYTSDELRAGFKKIDQFGIMNTIIAIAERFNYKFDEVLELDYVTVYIIMYRDKVKNDIQKKYYEILSKKKPKDGKR